MVQKCLCVVFYHSTLKKIWCKDQLVKELIKTKADQIRERKYVTSGEVKSLLNIFHVPNGLDDIWLANDGTKSCLNAAVWSPNFFLPTVTSLSRSIEATTWMTDVDLGEFF